MPVDLIGVGEVMLDVIVPTLRASHVVHEGISVRAGGVPLNAAVAAARSGASAAVVGRVGADAAAAAIERALARDGVESLLTVDPDRPTGTFVQSGDAIAADRGANAALSPSDLPARLDAGCVLVSGYALLHDDTSGAGRAAIDRADARYVAVAAPAASLLDRVGPDELHRRAEGATVVIANRDEALVLTGLEPPAAAAELARRYAIACVTAGPDGAYASADGDAAHAQAPPVTPDAVGAGDAFAGVFLTSLVRGADLAAALAAGCAAAARGR